MLGSSYDLLPFRLASLFAPLVCSEAVRTLDEEISDIWSILSMFR